MATASKSKYLKVTKSDKTIHLMPLANKPDQERFNNLLPVTEKAKLEVVELTSEEVENLPFRDEDYVTADEAVERLSAAEAEIAHLKRQLALKESAQSSGNEASGDPASVFTPFAAEAPATSTQTTEEFNQQIKSQVNEANAGEQHEEMKAADLAAAIKEAKTVEEVNQLFNGDTRVTVIAAATKRIAELSPKA